MQSPLTRSLLTLAALGALSAQSPAPSGGAAWCAAIPLSVTQPARCRALEIVAPHGTMRLALALTEAQRERGLMHVTYVPPLQGMLFVFPGGDGDRNFWMKNTVVPLDMVFVRSDGSISDVAANVPATPPHTPDDKVATRNGFAQYVIELGAGQAGALGLLPGTRLAIPPLEPR